MARKHWWLIGAVNLVAVGAAAYLAFQDPRVYRATATVRLGEARTALDAGLNSPVPAPQRTVDPVLSLSERLRSRQVVARVVDSLGTRLTSLTPDLPVTLLAGVRVAAEAAPDSIALRFGEREVAARFGRRQARAPYGAPIDFGQVRFAVTSRPADLPEALLAVTPRDMEIDHVLMGLEVVERQATDVIDVSYSATDPATAQHVVNAVVQTFQSFNIRSAQEQSRLRGVFLSDQLRQTDSAFAQAQATLAVFRSRQQLANSSDRLASGQAALLALDAQREQLVTDRRTYGELPELLASPVDSVSSAALRGLAFAPDMASNPTIAKLSQQLIEYQVKLDSVMTGPSRSAPTNPDLAQLRSAMASTKHELFNAVGSQVRSLDARIGALATLRQRSGASMQALPALAAEEVRLEARVDALRTIADQLRQEALRARLAEAAEVGDMQVMDLASLPYVAAWPQGLLKLILGVLAGLFLSAALVYLLEANNTSIRRPEDLEDTLQIGGLAVIPRVPGAGKTWRQPPDGLGANGGPRHGHRPPGGAQGLVTLAQPRSVGTEAFRMLRASIILSDWGRQLKTLVVTSVAPGEGKTLTAANLAVVFAREGMRVVLVDGDARRARLHKIFLMTRSPGLTELIRSDEPSSSKYAPPVGHTTGAGAADPSESATLAHIRPTALDRLFLLPAGTPLRASEGFPENRVRAVLDELSTNFDLVIIDAPPVLATADATSLASMADGVLFVVRAGRTHRRAIRQAHQQLLNVGAHVVGTVLNDPQGELKRDSEYYYPYEYPEAKD